MAEPAKKEEKIIIDEGLLDKIDVLKRYRAQAVAVYRFQLIRDLACISK